MTSAVDHTISTITSTTTALSSTDTHITPPPPQPPPHRPRSRSSASASTTAPMRRFTHCIFTQPNHPTTRWYLTFLHEGTYSEVYIGHPYSSTAGQAAVAIKVGKEGGAGGAREDEIRAMLYEEGRIMAQLQSTHSVCRLHHQPTPHDPHIDYHDSDDQRRNTQPPFIAMTLLLCDVSQLRKEAQLTRLAMWEVFVLMLRAMRGVHEGRILHRDVKPSNFGLAHAAWSSSINGSASPPLPLPASSATDSAATTPSSTASPPPLSVCIIDFGQSTNAFTSSSSSSSSSSPSSAATPTPHCPTSFKGKSLFASIARHEAKPQGRSDDLIMLLYIALDFLLPSPGLPWKTVHDKRSNLGADRGRDEIVRLKREWRDRWKSGERLSAATGETSGESVLVGLLERLESVKSEDEPPYDEVERELQRALDEEVKEVGDVGKTLSECVTEFMEGNDELKRKLNDKPPTAEEREREREEREKKRKERREQRQHDGRPHHHSVDLTIDTKRYTPNTSASSTTQQLPLPPTASPPLSANQPHSAWPAHSPSPVDASPVPGAAGSAGRTSTRMWPLQSLCECNSSVKSVLEFYCISETPRAVKAVNALLLMCSPADLQSKTMQQRTVLWLSDHPTVTVPMSSSLTSALPPSPLFDLFQPVALVQDSFLFVCLDACQRLRGRALESAGGGSAGGSGSAVVESVLAEWTALEGEPLQRRAEQLMKDRETIDLATLLPPPASTLGGRIAKPPPTAASNTPIAKPSAPATAAAPSGQAAAKSIVDSWMQQVPSKPTNAPVRAPIRRPISTLSAKPPSVTATKQPQPIVSAAAPPAPTPLPEPSALVALGKSGAGRRVPRKSSVADETSALSATVSETLNGSATMPSVPPPPATITPATDEPAAVLTSVSTTEPSPAPVAPSAPVSTTTPKPSPSRTTVTVKKTAVLKSIADKSAQGASKLLPAKESTPITDDLTKLKPSTGSTTDAQTTSSTIEAKEDTGKRKVGRPARKRAEAELQDEREVKEVVELAKTATRPPRGGRAQKAQREEKGQEEADESDSDTMSLTAFINQGRAKADSPDDGKQQSKEKQHDRSKQAKKVATEEEKKAERASSDELDSSGSDSSDSEQEAEPVLNEDGVYEVQTEVDYDEPPEDDVQREFVDRSHEAEQSIASQPMARYYRRAPYRVREKVQAKWRNKQWFDAVIVAVDRTHEMLALSKQDAIDRKALEKESRGTYPFTGVALHFKEYSGKEASQLRPDQLWCYKVMWLSDGTEDWFVESCLKHGWQQAAQITGKGADKEAGKVQAGKKRGRPRKAEADGEDERAAKKHAVNPIELALEQVPTPAETEDDKPISQLVNTQIQQAQQDKSSPAAVKKQQPPTSGTSNKPAAATAQKGRAGAEASDASDASDATMTHIAAHNSPSTSSKATTAKHEADQPSAAAAPTISTDTPTAAAAAAVAAGPTLTSPSTPTRHIPKKGGRFGSRSPLPSRETTPKHSSALINPAPTDSTPTESAPAAAKVEEVTAAATTAKIESVVKNGDESHVRTAVEGTAATPAAPVDKHAADTSDAAEANSSASNSSEISSTPVAKSDHSADVKADAAADSEANNPATPASTRSDSRTERASAPRSSLSSLSSPTPLKIAVPPPQPQPPQQPLPPPTTKFVRQRSRMSEGERLQFESVKRVAGQRTPSSSPLSDDSATALDWTAAGSGRSTRTRGSKGGSGGTPSASPVKEDEVAQGDQSPVVGGGGRKRGRRSSAAGGGADEGKETQAEVDIVGMNGSDGGKRSKRA